MRRALLEGEFKPFFQPMTDLRQGGIVCGAEALARWEKPGSGMISPAEFIPLFEKNGFIIELDLYIYECTCRVLRRWLQEGCQLRKVSVNVSRVSVFQPDFADKYIALKEKYQLPDGVLELECTETAAVHNAEGLESIMTRMRSNGFRFSMDDFGSGYSSLNLLKDITVDVLKLDMIFLKNNKLQESRNQTIVSSILAMAGKLGMKTVVEGVETPEQMAILQRLGCDYAQGYLFSKPVSEQEFEAHFLRSGGAK